VKLVCNNELQTLLILMNPSDIFVNTFLHFCHKKIKYFLTESSLKIIFSNFLSFILRPDVQIRLFDRAQYETLDVAQTLMDSTSERDGSGRWRCGMVPWKKKILLEKWMKGLAM
jgi:hypothetical protein